jgi:Flp pilus assembly pilin Flp
VGQRTRGQVFADVTKEEIQMSRTSFFRVMWSNNEGQDIAEYAVMLAVILVIVVGTIRLIGGNANNVFSSVASSIGQ